MSTAKRIDRTAMLAKLRRMLVLVPQEMNWRDAYVFTEEINDVIQALESNKTDAEIKEETQMMGEEIEQTGTPPPIGPAIKLVPDEPVNMVELMDAFMGAHGKVRP